MTADQILTDLKKKIYRPVYFLTGEEPYFIDKISDYIQETVLTETEKTFNLLVLYGKDTTAAHVTNAAKRYPMMSNYQVVIVKEAQVIKDIDDLIYYIEKPLTSTILVINYKSSLDKRKKISKIIAEKCVYLESKPLYDNKVADWINSYMKEKGQNIDPAASILLAEFLGTELSKIVNELDKLSILNGDSKATITSAMIEKNIGFSKDFNNFELSKALGLKDKGKAHQIALHLGKNQKTNPFILTLSVLYGFFSKLLIYHFLQDKSRPNLASQMGVAPFLVGEYEAAAKRYTVAKLCNIIGVLKEYDLKSKGVGDVSTSESDYLTEMVYKILK